MPFQSRIIVLVSDIPQLYIRIVTSAGHSIFLLRKYPKAIDRGGVPFEQIDLFSFCNVPDVDDAPVGARVNLLFLCVEGHGGDFALDLILAGIGCKTKGFLLSIKLVEPDIVQ